MFDMQSHSKHGQLVPHYIPIMVIIRQHLRVIHFLIGRTITLLKLGSVSRVQVGAHTPLSCEIPQNMDEAPMVIFPAAENYSTLFGQSQLGPDSEF